MARLSGLGKGLGALIPADATAGGGDVARLEDVPVASILPNPHQPRVHLQVAPDVDGVAQRVLQYLAEAGDQVSEPVADDGQDIEGYSSDLFVTDHLRQFGTVEVERQEFHRLLEPALVRNADFLALPMDAPPAQILTLLDAEATLA